MSGVRGLTIVVAGADGARLHASLSLAAANAALEGRTRVFLQAEAVALLGGGQEDVRYAAAGMPGVQELIGEVLAMGVEIIACQSGLALAGIAAATLPEGVETGGLVGLMAGLGEDRLVIA